MTLFFFLLSNPDLLVEGLFEIGFSEEPNAVDKPKPGQERETAEEKLATDFKFIRVFDFWIGQIHPELILKLRLKELLIRVGLRKVGTPVGIRKESQKLG